MSSQRAGTAVVTGASSGIGRATAEAFAAAGYAVVLVARREETLAEVATRCREGGAAVSVAAADVTDADALADVARRAVAEFGRIDVWVNNAGVLLYGRAEELDPAVWRRVVEVNLVGAYNGARAALPWLREQGRGVLINVGSLLSRTAAPQLSAYVASKHGVRALSRCLRQELHDAPGIAVSTVLPGTVDTALFGNAGNWAGRVPVPPGPAMDPRRVAAAIVGCAHRPRREVVVGGAARAALALDAVAPGLVDRFTARQADRLLFAATPAGRHDGALFRPRPEPAEPAGPADHGRRPRWAALVGAAVATAVLLRATRRAPWHTGPMTAAGGD